MTPLWIALLKISKVLDAQVPQLDKATYSVRLVSSSLAQIGESVIDCLMDFVNRNVHSFVQLSLHERLLFIRKVRRLELLVELPEVGDVINVFFESVDECGLTIFFDGRRHLLAPLSTLH